MLICLSLLSFCGDPPSHMLKWLFCSRWIYRITRHDIQWIFKMSGKYLIESDVLSGIWQSLLIFSKRLHQKLGCFKILQCRTESFKSLFFHVNLMSSNLDLTIRKTYMHGFLNTKILVSFYILSWQSSDKALKTTPTFKWQKLFHSDYQII